MPRALRSTVVFTLICFALAAWVGWDRTGTSAGVVETMWIVGVLAVLEVSLSFDNAVVNAAILRDMDVVWRKRFLTWGMVVAVFGMRIVFPIAIVAIAAQMGPIAALRLSLNDPTAYEHILHGAHIGIAGFGGAFLLMVGLDFFFDCDKDVHWIAVVEKTLARFGAVQAMGMAVVLLILWGVSRLLEPDHAMTYLVAGIFGLITYVVVDGISAILEAGEGEHGHAGSGAAVAGAAVKGGFGAFLYLNLLDASFSFDGVIGAFALSNNMLVIALGLSIGAMAVRALTLMMVEKQTLAQYRYIEHGAFWAIIALGAIMLVSAWREVPEAVTGLIGAVLIGLSFWWSVRFKRKEAAIQGASVAVSKG